MAFIRTAEYFFVQTVKFFPDLHAADIQRPGVLYRLRDHAGALFGFVPAFEKEIAPLIPHSADDPVLFIEDLASDSADHFPGGKNIRNIIDLHESGRTGRPHRGADLAQVEILLKSPLSCIHHFGRQAAFLVGMAEHP